MFLQLFSITCLQCIYLHFIGTIYLESISNINHVENALQYHMFDNAFKLLLILTYSRENAL